MPPLTAPSAVPLRASLLAACPPPPDVPPPLVSAVPQAASMIAAAAAIAVSDALVLLIDSSSLDRPGQALGPGTATRALSTNGASALEP